VAQVLLVHGIWDSPARLEPLRAGLEARGVTHARPVSLVPNDGRTGIADLARLVAAAVDSLPLAREQVPVDVVGFSMGALVTRWYLQRGGGRDRVRRFVSIAGPHHGTVTACVPAAGRPGIRDMRPGSPLLRDLASDAAPFGSVEVHCLYSPFDLMVVPATTAILPGARTVTAFRVPLHRLLISDERVLDHVARLLRY
jgi:triacylglycerol lipase